MIYSIPAPFQKSKATDLLVRCDKLSREDKSNEVLLRRLKNEAERLLKQSRHEPHAHEALGCIYTFMNKEEFARKIFQQALAQFPQDPEIYVNYAVCLNQLGFPEEAADYARHAYHIRKGEPFILKTLIESSLFAAKFHQAYHWITHWQKEYPHTPHPFSEIIHKIHITLTDAHIADEITGQIMKIALNILRENNIHIGTQVSYRNEIREDEETQWVTRVMRIDHEKLDAIGLNIELAERLAAEEEFGKQLKGKFIVRYIVME